MKLKNFAPLIVIATFILVASGCKKSFFTDVNKNPNVVSSVPPGQLLSTVEAALAYTQGGDLSRYSSLFTQQVFGQNSQSQSYYIYNVNPGVFDNVWPDLYTSTMENDYTLIQVSDAGGYNIYAGISRIIMAYTLQITVDSWGDVPYSQAFHGNLQDQNLHPVFDDDKALYDTIAKLLDVGISKLSATDLGNLVPGAEDVIYDGDSENWIKFAHAIKARLYLHQSKGDASMATKALSEIAQSFKSNADNAQYNFGTAETAANPWYQFNRDRPGDETFSTSTLAKKMLATHDPRYAIFFDSTNETKSKKGNHYGGLNDYYGSVNSPVEFITYDELQFASAEATLTATQNYAAAQTFYQSGIMNNMKKLGVPATAITTYIAANGILPVTSVDNAIAKVASQEFIALFLNPEAWTLWRRTGSPALTPTAGTAIPRRLLWPQSEYSYNAANAPATNTLTSPKIFWDK
jgi:hypothetical protein